MATPRRRELKEQQITWTSSPASNPATLKLLQEHDRMLVCVRYRVDVLQRKRYKTVELIVAEQDWYPPAPAGARKVPGRYLDARAVLVRASYAERDLHARGRWTVVAGSQIVAAATAARDRAWIAR